MPRTPTTTRSSAVTACGLCNPHTSIPPRYHHRRAASLPLLPPQQPDKSALLSLNVFKDTSALLSLNAFKAFAFTDKSALLSLIASKAPQNCRSSTSAPQRLTAQLASSPRHHLPGDDGVCSLEMIVVSMTGHDCPPRHHGVCSLGLAAFSPLSPRKCCDAAL